jgi:hypothetical protein
MNFTMSLGVKSALLCKCVLTNDVKCSTASGHLIEWAKNNKVTTAGVNTGPNRVWLAAEPCNAHNNFRQATESVGGIRQKRNAIFATSFTGDAHDL